MPILLATAVERWPIAGSFAISRGSKTEAAVVVVEVVDGPHRGRGECVPYARYGESVESVVASIAAQQSAIAAGMDRAALQNLMAAGAARNALDCALWDLEAKRAGKGVHVLAGLSAPKPRVTAFTISLGTPDTMAAATRAAAARPLLKVKLGSDDDAARIAAVRAAAPEAELIVDANEGWTAKTLESNLKACARAGVTLIEQPLPANDDAVLAAVTHAVPICADESVHGLGSLDTLQGRYDAINIKLDKTGGLTEALALAADAHARGIAIMVGCMVATSLSMAPALLVAQRAAVVDLDGPLLLSADRADGLRYDGSLVYPSTPALWG